MLKACDRKVTSPEDASLEGVDSPDYARNLANDAITDRRRAEQDNSDVRSRFLCTISSQVIASLTHRKPTKVSGLAVSLRNCQLIQRSAVRLGHSQSLDRPRQGTSLHLEPGTLLPSAIAVCLRPLPRHHDAHLNEYVVSVAMFAPWQCC
jgi:hypothetical protein